MRKPGLEVVFSVAVWPDLGRVARAEFDAIQHAVAEAVAIANDTRKGVAARQTLRIPGFAIECLHDPEARQFTVERVLRTPPPARPG